jgi:hypothetical protein
MSGVSFRRAQATIPIRENNQEKPYALSMPGFTQLGCVDVEVDGWRRRMKTRGLNEVRSMHALVVSLSFL